jgi:L-ascorbate metabolism protein UlaG (beta-lactamase superfamily)
MTVTHEGLRVDWLGYATVRVEGSDAVVYLDPGRYGVLDGHRPRDGDLVCVTHDHHYDSEGIDRVAGEDATLVVYEGVDPGGIDRDVAPLDELGRRVDRVGERVSVRADGVRVETVPAHNTPDGHVREDGTPYHPEGFGVGYRVVVDGVSLFWPGDTDVLDVHDEVAASVLCPPIGGSFTMDRHEAAALADDLEPGLVVPVHYDTFEALETDRRAFAADVAERGVPVALEDPEQTP